MSNRRRAAKRECSSCGVWGDAFAFGGFLVSETPDGRLLVEDCDPGLCPDCFEAKHPQPDEGPDPRLGGVL
jgi:hypothetical protein